MKKIFKILGIVFLIILTLLIATPFFLESKIDTIIKKYADNNLNANLSFDDVNLSLISSFPKAEVNVDNLKITTRVPFEDETLVTAKSLAFEMPLGEIFKGSDEPLVINEIIADELLLTLLTNEKGAVNYNIIKEDEEAVSQNSEESSDTFAFDIQNYELNNSSFTFIDEASNTKVYVTEINHSGKGIFSGDTSELDTHTEARVSLSVDSTDYLSNNTIKLDALIDLDLEEQKYTFKENKGLINALPLHFEGYLQNIEEGQNIDITFENPESDFKAFLAVIPEVYSKNIENVNTTGNFKVNGLIKGLVSDETIPTLDINIQSDDASFKYPDLPKSVNNISIDASVKNTTGKTEDTYIDINKLNFRIDEDVFTSEAHIKNITDNILVNASLNGVLNLANITKAYPIELENELSGILKANINTVFDMDAIETNTYQRIKNSGDMSVTDFIFSSEDIVNPIQINKANLVFNPSTVSLNSFDAQTGDSDFSAKGTITNLLGFLLSDKKLQGDFDVRSKRFAIADFMVEDKTVSETSNKTSSDTESLKIPDFLDCTISAKANTVIYDNLELKNVDGILRIKDQNAYLSQMTTDLFNGKLGISGNVNTSEEQPAFDMNLAMQQFDISQSFKDLDLLKSFAPIAKIVEGKLNSTIDIKGLLGADFTPDLATISGDAFAELFTSKISESESPLLSSLSSKLDFINFKELEQDIKTRLSFKDGDVVVKPFKIQYKDIPIEVSGTHSLSNTMNYGATFNVPAKYLGADVNRLIGKINDPEVDNISIPVTTTIGGTFSKPNVSTDLSSSVSNLTNQLLEIQKQKLIGEGTDKVGDLLGGLLGNNTTKEVDSTALDTTTPLTKDPLKEGVKNALGGILSGKKKKKDSTKI